MIRMTGTSHAFIDHQPHIRADEDSTKKTDPLNIVAVDIS
jgi:hypothetical protein